ncbi:hypothetical protein VN12_04155 [Pirellula sp. SH-Sr6A]|uniref:hypothetical protein n=1 Tax=Pirellula sp. SH-Sr6A TaxID=1632865 RepID=UPI00078E3993|nr:hypothetical protein [Pirellula sp. SH-Sr6A]AMV31285.1 hypothetical protein VN12_04155 [Pirellula sp. SH-Sr6A]
MKHQTPTLLKFKKLKRRLGLTKDRDVMGLLESLWILAQRSAPCGDIGNQLDNEELAIELEWEGDPDELVSALVDTKWLDACEVHRLIIHDWPSHAPRYIHGIAAKRGGFATPTIIGDCSRGLSNQEMAEAENDHSGTVVEDYSPPLNASSSPTTVDDCTRQQPNLTKPNLTKPNERERTHTLANSRSEKFDQAWNRWRAHRNENFQRLTPTSEDAALMELARCFPDDEESQIAAIEFSILRGAKNLITNGDHRVKASPRDSPSPEDRTARRTHLLSEIGKV